MKDKGIHSPVKGVFPLIPNSASLVPNRLPMLIKLITLNSSAYKNYPSEPLAFKNNSDSIWYAMLTVFA
jgi:hypothetical protein